MFICINRYNHNFLYTRCMCPKILMMIRKRQKNINDVKGKCKCNIPFFLFFINYQVMNLSFKNPPRAGVPNGKLPLCILNHGLSQVCQARYIYFLKQLFNADISSNVHGFLVAFYLTIVHLTLCKVDCTRLRVWRFREKLKLKTIPPNPDQYIL